MIKNLRQSFVAIILVFWTVFLCNLSFAQPKNATVKVSKDITYQKISGFGGFVNSPQFAYNYMTETEIRKMWGANSEAGYNIMRLYIPTGENNWAQVIPTAQLAKSLGIKIFASPWSMPTQWKTDNVIGSVFTDEYGVKRNVYLKEEHYADYANYLNNFVVLLRNNGVELDAISIQNEPDFQVDYAGCIFTPAQMTKFLKENRHLITCKVMAPETVGIPDNYANAFNASDVLPHFDIFAGHQYGSIQTAHKNLQTKGKEVWMSEFLINWNQNGVSRNFDWSIDGFDFAGKINEAMLANINAWIHYATKRYYAMMGDGSFGIPLSEISKRGRILSHFSKYVNGNTRTEATWNDNTGILKGSSYFSATGDSITIVVINGSANSYNLTVDLPFLSNTGKAITTNQTDNMAESAVNLASETNRPKVSIGPLSVTTLVFIKSNNLVPSQMTGQLVNYTLIDNLNSTNPSFGTNYKLSGKTATFKVDVPLISSNQNANNGYLPLNGKFNRLVFRVENISSAGSYTSANTTLYYINNSGVVRSYNYGTVTFNLRNNFDWVLDISENVLTDGCQGIIGLYNSNFVSILTLKLNNVFLAVGSERGFNFNGPFSKSDGNLLDCLDDVTFTSLNFNTVSAVPATTNLHAEAVNKNAVYYVQTADVADKNNVVFNEICNKLELKESTGDFYPPIGFNASSAKLTTQLNGPRMLTLPFEATIPDGVQAFSISFLNAAIQGTLITNGKIPANTPVLVNGFGTYVFEGSGRIDPNPNFKAGITFGMYIGIKVPVGAYFLKMDNGVPTFSRVANINSQPDVKAFDAYLVLSADQTLASVLQVNLDAVLPVTLTTFKAKAEGKNILLNWETRTEINNSGFAIERSENGNDFKQIGFVKGNVNTHVSILYKFIDHAPLKGNNFYRLKQVDDNGRYHYSKVKLVKFGAEPIVTMYPNPVQNELIMNGNGEPLSGTIIVLDEVGRVMLQSKISSADIHRLDISKLAAGIYFYRFNQLSGSFIKH